MRFHALAIPHTITNKEFVACAYTQKVYKFCEMMIKRGHTVYHYGHQDSDVPCTEHVTVVSREKFNTLYGGDRYRSKTFTWDINDDVYKEFELNACIEISTRKQYGDFILAFWGHAHKPICDRVASGDVIVVEPGIGYSATFAGYQIYESYALLHAKLGIENSKTAMNIPWYHTVIPNYFDPNDFEFNRNKGDYFLCLGRINKGKGVDMAIQITEKIGAKLILAGQGGPEDVGLTEWPAHVECVGYALSDQRKNLMKNAKGFFILSTYIEPFGGAMIEALFCGTPVISTDIGAFVENNLHGITGYRCRTFGQMVWAAQNIHRIDPQACRNWAENFSVERVAPMYEEYFQSVYDGWYGAVAKLPLLPVRIYEKKTPRIAVWSETKWALGRIAAAIRKYVPNVDVFDWSVDDFWTPGVWKDYDVILSNTTLHTIESLYGIKPDPKKLLVTSHCPKFNLAHFNENTEFIEGAKYAGVSQETCQELARHGRSDAAWTPFGADGDVFARTHAVSGPIKRIGMINADCTLEEYVKVKGLEKFKEICSLGNFEPVNIMGQSEKIYENIDLLICCSEFDAGPLGIFEAASCGVPVLTTAVGNAKLIEGIAIFETAREAVDRIHSWNNNLEELRLYAESLTHQVRTEWSMETLIHRHLAPILKNWSDE